MFGWRWPRRRERSRDSGVRPRRRPTRRHDRKRMTVPDATRITHLLRSWRGGDRSAEQRLFEALHAELRGLADRLMRSERSDHTLQPTELVHEVYLRLGSDAADWQDRAHFFAVAARAMRRLLIDHARARASARRGGGLHRVTLDMRALPGESAHVDVGILDRALARLQELDERKARFVEMRYFAGLTNAEIAHVAGVSERTVKRELQLGRAWLRREIEEGVGAALPDRRPE